MLREFSECVSTTNTGNAAGYGYESLRVSRPIQSPFNGIFHVISLSANRILSLWVSQNWTQVENVFGHVFLSLFPSFLFRIRKQCCDYVIHSREMPKRIIKPTIQGTKHDIELTFKFDLIFYLWSHTLHSKIGFDSTTEQFQFLFRFLYIYALVYIGEYMCVCVCVWQKKNFRWYCWGKTENNTRRARNTNWISPSALRLPGGACAPILRQLGNEGM